VARCQLSAGAKLTTDNWQLRVYEGTGIGKKDLRQMQGNSPARRGPRDLRERKAQATARLKKWIVVSG
jgi:hypothetical protein